MDIISQLSDDLLIRILSFVQTKHALATSCLSKRWQLLWSLVPKLEYNDISHSGNNYESFTQFVYRSLLLNKAPVLESLNLKLGPTCQAVDIGIWIDIAVPRGVHSLIVHIIAVDPIGLPSSLYTCETLETLRLVFCILLDTPSSVWLPSLKSLHLEAVDYADKESLAKLLSGCPKLEHLAVKQDKLDVALAVPSLRRLVMTNYERGGNGSGFVIDAPSLEYLHIEDEVLYDFHRIEYMPKLEVAFVDMVQGVDDHKFLKAFTSVHSLYLRLPFSEVLSSSDMIFHRLVNLELSTCVQGWWDLLTHMLQVSPKLRYLRLNDVHMREPSVLSGKETPDYWKRPSCVPKCLLNSLEAFVWNGYKGRRGDRDVATYLVANASRLKTATFYPESKDVGARYTMIQYLASLARLSPFQLFFQ